MGRGKGNTELTSHRLAWAKEQIGMVRQTLDASLTLHHRWMPAHMQQAANATGSE